MTGVQADMASRCSLRQTILTEIKTLIRSSKNGRAGRRMTREHPTRGQRSSGGRPCCCRLVLRPSVASLGSVWVLESQTPGEPCDSTSRAVRIPRVRRWHLWQVHGRQKSVSRDGARRAPMTAQLCGRLGEALSPSHTAICLVNGVGRLQQRRTGFLLGFPPGLVSSWRLLCLFRRISRGGQGCFALNRKLHPPAGATDSGVRAFEIVLVAVLARRTVVARLVFASCAAGQAAVVSFKLTDSGRRIVRCLCIGIPHRGAHSVLICVRPVIRRMRRVWPVDGCRQEDYTMPSYSNAES